MKELTAFNLFRLIAYFITEALNDWEYVNTLADFLKRRYTTLEIKI